MSREFVFRSLGLSAAALLVAGADCTLAGFEQPPDSLTVIDHNDTWARGNGDEVAIGRIRFHATFGEPGSTEVTVDDRLQELGSDLSENEGILLPEDLVRIGQLDFGGVPIVDWEDDVVAHDAPVALSGSIAVAIELDAVGTDTARSRIADARDTLRDALEFFIAGTHGSLSGSSGLEKLEIIAKRFYCVHAVVSAVPLMPGQCPAHPDHPEWSDAGGGGRLGKWFKSWFKNIGHDPIGNGGVLSLNLVPDDFDAQLAAIRAFAPGFGVEPEEIPACGDAPHGPEEVLLCAPRVRSVSIHLTDEDAHWRIDTQVIPPPE